MFLVNFGWIRWILKRIIIPNKNMERLRFFPFVINEIWRDKFFDQLFQHRNSLEIMKINWKNLQRAFEFRPFFYLKIDNVIWLYFLGCFKKSSCSIYKPTYSSHDFNHLSNSSKNPISDMNFGFLPNSAFIDLFSFENNECKK